MIYRTIIFVLIMIGASFANEINVAIKANDFNEVKRLYKKDPSIVDSKTVEGVTPLHLAAALNEYDIVLFLIKHNADVNAKTIRGYTPLHWAAYMDAVKTFDLLVKSGAKVGIKSVSGYTPADLAESEGATNVIKYINKMNISVNSSEYYTQINKAKLALKKGDISDAYRIASNMIVKYPNAEVNFLYGMICMEKKDFVRAKAAFERVLMIEPDNPRVKVALGRCYALEGQDLKKAREILQDALLDVKNPIVRKNILDYITELEKGINNWILNGIITVGYLYDSNPNIGPNSQSITIQPIDVYGVKFDKLDVDKESLPHESGGASVSGVIQEIYDGGERGYWAGSIDAQFYANNLNDASDYETLFYQISTGLRYKNPKNSIYIPLRYAHIYTGGDSLVDIIGIAPEYIYTTLFSDSAVSYSTTAVIENRNYTDLDLRDGVFLSLGEIIKYEFGRKHHQLSTGVIFVRDNTDDDIYTYNSFAVTFGCDIKIPFHSGIFAKLYRYKADYVGKEELAPDDRVDIQTQYSIGIYKNFADWFRCDLSYTYTDNSSTFNLYSYNRYITTFNISYIF